MKQPQNHMHKSQQKIITTKKLTLVVFSQLVQRLAKRRPVNSGQDARHFLPDVSGRLWPACLLKPRDDLSAQLLHNLEDLRLGQAEDIVVPGVARREEELRAQDVGYCALIEVRCTARAVNPQHVGLDVRGHAGQRIDALLLLLDVGVLLILQLHRLHIHLTALRRRTATRCLLLNLTQPALEDVARARLARRAPQQAAELLDAFADLLQVVVADLSGGGGC